MHIQIERNIQIKDGISSLANRLKNWSHKYRFTCHQNSNGQWIYKRGTPLQAFYTFDIRKVPTTVTMNALGENPTIVQCRILVKSGLQLATPDDPMRVEEQLDLLEAYLEGVFESETQ
ncbi:MAG: hypothetical protein JJU05_07385 [Verrucomicrobia bacterium]|nr:hypothetical protein [Verrucomicrobiota bacterium]MCH8526120.1 hypothetical protein [Kiritimatiellia bacterium]